MREKYVLLVVLLLTFYFDVMCHIKRERHHSLLTRLRNKRLSRFNEKPPVRYTTHSFTNVTFKHAESPVCDPDINLLYWVDVLNQNVHVLDYVTGKHVVRHIEQGEVNFVTPIQNSNRVLVGVNSELYLLDWRTQGREGMRLVALVDQGKPDNILNEGKADGLGRLWAGTKGAQVGAAVTPDQGSLYKFSQPDFFPRVQLKPVTISNGMTWALNNSVFFYIDSPTKKIEAFDFDLEKGQISRRRTILDIRDYGYKDAIPDGMTIDRDGKLWVALMFGGAVIRIDPDSRRLLETYELPVSGVSSVCWSGLDLDRLVVTTSRRHLDENSLTREPHAGSLFILSDTGTSGIPSYKVAFDNADEY